MLEIVKDIVKEAGHHMLSGYNTCIEKGSASNLVTDKDIFLQNFLCNKLADVFDDIGFIGEESSPSDNPLEKEYTAIIDPIDGTSNFVRGINLSVISVGLLKKGKPYIGVVYAPFTAEMFYAQVGKGAYLNGRKISVSDRDIASSLLFTGWAIYKKEASVPCFDLCRDAYLEIDDIRRLGSCALELCYIAAGRGELYFEIRVCSWDFAGAAIILTEAGGYIAQLDCEKVDYTAPHPLIAANTKEGFEYIKEKTQKHILGWLKNGKI